MSHPVNKKAGAFTLVEMLVTIAIIAILAVILFMGYEAVMSRADAAKCMSNLKTYAANAGSFIADNNGAIPGKGIPESRRPGGSAAAADWQKVLRNYPELPSPPQPLMCPALVKKIRKYKPATHWPPPSGPGASKWIWWNGYNVNGLFNTSFGDSASMRNGTLVDSSPARITQITYPSKTPLYMDVDMSGIDEDGKSVPTGDANGGEMWNGATTSNYRFWPAHGNAFNIAFFDGHVERVLFNKEGAVRQGKAAGDYPQFDWHPFKSPKWDPSLVK